MANETVRFKFADGKYEYVREPGFRAHVYRHGEEWRDVTGDGFILSMIQRIEELEESLEEMETLIRKLMGDELTQAIVELKKASQGSLDEGMRKAIAELEEEGRKAASAITGKES